MTIKEPIVLGLLLNYGPKREGPWAAARRSPLAVLWDAQNWVGAL